MSHPDVLIGYIIEDSIHDRMDHVRCWNDSVLADLPETDVYPPLIRSMVAAPQANQAAAAFRGSRVISIALHQNWLHKALDRWLPKFEDLLARLYWSEARLSIDTAWSGEYDLTYSWDDDAWKARRGNEPGLGRGWALRCVRRGPGVPARRLEGVSARPGYTEQPRLTGISERDRVRRLLDIAETVRRVTTGRGRAELDSDEMFRITLVHALREFCREAAWVSSTCQGRLPSVPWRDLVYVESGLPREWNGPLPENEADDAWRYLQHSLAAMIVELQEALEHWPT